MYPLLVPVHLSVKSIDAPLSVPALGGAAFQDGATLEPGLHLHWALPDALTRARRIEKFVGMLARGEVPYPDR